MNGRIGKQNREIENIMGVEGEEVKNNNGERIIKLCIENNLIITNAKFKHKNVHTHERTAI